MKIRLIILIVALVAAVFLYYYQDIAAIIVGKIWTVLKPFWKNILWFFSKHSVGIFIKLAMQQLGKLVWILLTLLGISGWLWKLFFQIKRFILGVYELWKHLPLWAKATVLVCMCVALFMFGAGLFITIGIGFVVDWIIQKTFAVGLEKLIHTWIQKLPNRWRQRIETWFAKSWIRKILRAIDQRSKRRKAKARTKMKWRLQKKYYRNKKTKKPVVYR